MNSTPISGILEIKEKGSEDREDKLLSWNVSFHMNHNWEDKNVSFCTELCQFYTVANY